MTGREKTEPVLQKLPLRTETAKRLVRYMAECPGTKIFMLSVDYSPMGLRILAQLGAVDKK